MSKRTSPILGITLAGVLALLVSPAHGALVDNFGSGPNTFSIQFTDVGNAGNAADTVTPNPGYGAVPYAYRMGVTEVSRDWLAKAGTPGGNPSLGSNLPAASITWFEAAAFVNYLNTSTGHVAAYSLNGTSSLNLWSAADAWTLGGTNLYRHKDAYYFLPSENEWYKAAYYDPSATGYNLYPTGSSTPGAVSSGTTAGTAVYNRQPGPADVNNAGGLSPYGTMGQGGNVWEWQESAFDGSNNTSSENRAIRGGYWSFPEDILRSSFRNNFVPTASNFGVGFRVASVPDAPVPEPTTAVFGIALSLSCLLTRRRARSL